MLLGLLLLIRVESVDELYQITNSECSEDISSPS